MLRKLVTGVGVALAVFAGMASASGLAVADVNPKDPIGISPQPPTSPGTWVYVQWYQGSNSMASLAQCVQDAQRQYPGRDYQCKADNTGNFLLLWVKY
ncbi:MULTISPECIES: hypothetical protein [Amycolatopsis]|uniref:Uncharacterized protein n=2 Tax=Amycolatopsis TaxID=1813 RepID=A0A1I3XWH4_9PSEU|nr:hypothetical protein [Amycolatopsis sacchari]SFK23619.1 hypothetical protein SAMN05421835_11665 [Amycolatopsis sacchari]